MRYIDIMQIQCEETRNKIYEKLNTIPMCYSKDLQKMVPLKDINYCNLCELKQLEVDTIPFEQLKEINDDKICTAITIDRTEKFNKIIENTTLKMLTGEKGIII